MPASGAASLSGTRTRRATEPEDTERFRLDVEKVASGEERRTTLRVANVPSKYQLDTMLSIFERNFAGRFDFFYLPFDFRRAGNLGH